MFLNQPGVVQPSSRGAARWGLGFMRRAGCFWSAVAPARASSVDNGGIDTFVRVALTAGTRGSWRAGGWSFGIRSIRLLPSMPFGRARKG